MAKQQKQEQRIDGYTGKPIEPQGKVIDHMGFRRAELLQIVCALLAGGTTYSRDGVVQEAKQFLRLIDDAQP